MSTDTEWRFPTLDEINAADARPWTAIEDIPAEAIVEVRTRPDGVIEVRALKCADGNLVKRDHIRPARLPLHETF